MRHTRRTLIGVLALLACWAPAFGQVHQLERRTAVGETVRIRGHVNYRPCGTVIDTAIVLNVAPSHGTLSVRDEIVPSNDPDLGKGGKCQGYSGQGKVVYYTRTSAGKDRFAYTSSFLNGEVHIEVTVD